jgi:hypothetical protein
MSSTVKLTETPRQGLDAVNPKLNQQYDQFVALLAQRVGRAHAKLFAEPVPITMAKTGLPGLAWFADGDGEAAPVVGLEAGEAQALRRVAGRLRSEVAAFADALEREGAASRELARLIRDALVTPDDDHLWSLGGQPVLVAWGYRHAQGMGVVAERNGAITGSAAAAMVTPRTSQAARHSSAPPPPRPEAVNDAGVVRARSALVPVLWLVFALLSLALGDRLLQACAIGSANWPDWLKGVLPDHCPVASLGIDPADLSQRAAIQAIEGEVHAAELALTRRALSCDASCPLPSRAAIPGPSTPVTPPRAIAADVERRLERIERGRYLELTLAWDGAADLDLQVACPDQARISFNNRSACGGRLVADQNEGGGTSASRPVEHIIWDEAPTPAGVFGIAVALYDRHGDARPSIPFRLVLSQNGRVMREEEGRVSAPRVSQSVFTFPVPIVPASGAPAMP